MYCQPIKGKKKKLAKQQSIPPKKQTLTKIEMFYVWYYSFCSPKKTGEWRTMHNNTEPSVCMDLTKKLNNETERKRAKHSK